MEKEITTSIQTTQPSAPTVNKRRRGQYPRLSLKKAIELPKAIYEVGQGEPVRRVKVFDQLGKSAESSLSRALVTIAGQYGLTIGGYQAEYLTLTDIGKLIVMEPNTKRTLRLIYEILFNNDIFASFIEHWKDKAMPVDDIASDWLLRKYSLTIEDARAYWAVIKDNILDFNLTEHLSGKQYVRSKEVAFQDISEKSEVEKDENSAIITNSGTSNIADAGKEKNNTSIQTVNIDLENGGRAQITVPVSKELTKTDVKKLKAQIDILSNFIDQ